jgi:hypothetical protein
MKQLLLGAALVGIGTVIGALSSDNTSGTANAQFAPPSGQSGDALWHLAKVWSIRIVFALKQRTR